MSLTVLESYDFFFFLHNNELKPSTSKPYKVFIVNSIKQSESAKQILPVSLVSFCWNQLWHILNGLSHLSGGSGA